MKTPTRFPRYPEVRRAWWGLSARGRRRLTLPSSGPAFGGPLKSNVRRHQMRLILVASVLLCVSASTSAAGRPKGVNCDLAAPPSTAGEDFAHGATLRIYPRARDMSDGYTGCQLLWVPKGNHWTIISSTEVVKGEPVRIWSPSRSDQTRFSCRYAHGVVVRGKAATCVAPEFLIYKSMAPGCVAKLQESTSGGVSGPAPPAGCEPE